MKENNSFMGWNAPGSDGPQKPQNTNPQGDNNPNEGDNERLDDIWNRHRNKKGLDAPDLLKKTQKFLKGGNNGDFGKKTSGSIKSFIYALLVILVGIYIFLGFYTVKEAERGVVLRFGKFYEVVDPGLQWKLTGIDQVFTVDIEQVRSIQSSGAMLTEDENVVIVEMDVQYRISDPFQYLFSVNNPDNSLMEATDSALRFVIGHTLMDDILTSGRERVRQDTRELLNSIIDPYKMGLTIVDVNFLPARAPDEVKEAFDDAIAAQEDEQRFKREAEAYANEVLPRAEGQVQRIRQESEAYRSQVVLDAQGQVARFEQILPEYNAAPEITRTRIYLETMQEVLSSSSKIILDTPEGSTPVLYLPMPTQNGQVVKAKPNSNSVPNVKPMDNSYYAPSSQQSNVSTTRRSVNSTSPTGRSAPERTGYTYQGGR